MSVKFSIYEPVGGTIVTNERVALSFIMYEPICVRLVYKWTNGWKVLRNMIQCVERVSVCDRECALRIQYCINISLIVFKLFIPMISSYSSQWFHCAKVSRPFNLILTNAFLPTY